MENTKKQFAQTLRLQRAIHSGSLTTLLGIQKTGDSFIREGLKQMNMVSKNKADIWLTAMDQCLQNSENVLQFVEQGYDKLEETVGSVFEGAQAKQHDRREKTETVKAATASKAKTNVEPVKKAAVTTTTKKASPAPRKRTPTRTAASKQKTAVKSKTATGSKTTTKSKTAAKPGSTTKRTTSGAVKQAEQKKQTQSTTQVK